MTLRHFCRRMAEFAFRGFAKAADMPDPQVLTVRKPVKVLAICPHDHDHLLMRMAAFHDGWELSLARSLRDALVLLRRGAHSIVIYDADLEHPDKFEALWQLVSPGYERIVILMAERVTDELWRKAIELGAFDVLEKPLLGTELLAAVSDVRYVLETGEVRAQAAR